MSTPLPAEEIRTLLGENGFLRLYGQDTHLFVSDIPRRVSRDALIGIRQALLQHGFTATADLSDLLLIDMQPERWKTLLSTFTPQQPVVFPRDEALHGVYALLRLLHLHPAGFEHQPLPLLRSVLKRYTDRDELIRLVPKLHAQCAQRLRQGKPLPSALENVFHVWIDKQL